jgi:hypothetical protein
VKEGAGWASVRGLGAGLLPCGSCGTGAWRHGRAEHGMGRAEQAGQADMDMDMVIWGRVANEPATGRKRRACGHDIRYARGIRMRVRR